MRTTYKTETFFDADIEYDRHYDKLCFSMLQGLTPAKQKYVLEFISAIYHTDLDRLPALPLAHILNGLDKKDNGDDTEEEEEDEPFAEEDDEEDHEYYADLKSENVKLKGIMKRLIDQNKQLKTAIFKKQD